MDKDEDFLNEQQSDGRSRSQSALFWLRKRRKVIEKEMNKKKKYIKEKGIKTAK